MNKEFHAVADLFPLLRGPAFEELVADIKKNGLHEPILCDAEGRILDGRNRYRACLQAGVEPRFVEWRGEGELGELALSLNLRRRHLDESQRAMVAARLAKMMAAKQEGAGRGANLLTRQFRKSRDQAAAMVNVSTRLVIHASKVIKDGADELIAAVESGGLAVSAASVLAGRPKEEQVEAVSRGTRAAASKARELRAGKKKGEPARPSAGCFGVLSVDAERGGADDVALLWVPAGALDHAIETLKAGGFHLAPAEL